MSSSGLSWKPWSETLATYIVGFIVNRKNGFSTSRSPSERSAVRAGRASFSTTSTFSSAVTIRAASLSPPERATFAYFASCLSAAAMSASASSVLIVSMSEIGFTLPVTWTTLSSSKQRTTCAMASVSRMLARNWLPRPSPFDAPATSPAMSTNSTTAGITRSGLAMTASAASRGSGTSTMPTLGSIVQNG